MVWCSFWASSRSASPFLPSIWAGSSLTNEPALIGCLLTRTSYAKTVSFTLARSVSSVAALHVATPVPLVTSLLRRMMKLGALSLPQRSDVAHARTFLANTAASVTNPPVLSHPMMLSSILMQRRESSLSVSSLKTAQILYATPQAVRHVATVSISWRIKLAVYVATFSLTAQPVTLPKFAPLAKTSASS